MRPWLPALALALALALAALGGSRARADEVARIAPSLAPSRLALAGGRLARLDGAHWIVWDASGKRIVDRELDAPRGLGRAGDDSLVAVTRKTACWLAPTGLEPTCAPVAVVGIEALRVEAAAPGFWTCADGVAAQRLRFERIAGALASDATVTLADQRCAGAAALGDELLVAVPGALERRTGKLSSRLPLSAGVVVHLGPAAAGRAWSSLATPRGDQVVLLKLDATAAPQRRFAPPSRLVGAQVHTLASDAGVAVVLWLVQTASTPRWELEVVESTGARRRIKLPWQPDPGAALAISARPPRVALADSHGVALWNASNGRRLPRE